MMRSEIVGKMSKEVTKGERIQNSSEHLKEE